MVSSQLIHVLLRCGIKIPQVDEGDPDSPEVDLDGLSDRWVQSGYEICDDGRSYHPAEIITLVNIKLIPNNRSASNYEYYGFISIPKQ